MTVKKDSILLTRPLEKSQALAGIIEKMGYRPVLAPALDIRYLPGKLPTLTAFDALVFTSVFGVNGAMQNIDPGERRPDLPVFAVGDATAAQARAAGFEFVVSAKGDGDDLAQTIRATLKPGKLLHICGQDYSGKLEPLKREGFTIDRCPVYKAMAAENLPPAAVEAIENGKLAATLLFSPRTAVILVRLLDGLGLETACAQIHALCLSADVAQKARTLRWKSVKIAKRPDQESLLALLAKGNL